jgi:hypothetical protein
MELLFKKDKCGELVLSKSSSEFLDGEAKYHNQLSASYRDKAQLAQDPAQTKHFHTLADAHDMSSRAIDASKIAAQTGRADHTAYAKEKLNAAIKAHSSFPDQKTNSHLIHQHSIKFHQDLLDQLN